MNCTMIWRRVAPTALRTPTSTARRVARAVIMLTKLPHATTRMSTAMPIIAFTTADHPEASCRDPLRGWRWMPEIGERRNVYSPSQSGCRLIARNMGFDECRQPRPDTPRCRAGTQADVSERVLAPERAGAPLHGIRLVNAEKVATPGRNRSLARWLWKASPRSRR